MRQFMAAARALGDPNRARIVMALRGGELCVCRIIELLQLAPSTVSKHLTILHQAGLIESRKEGRWIHYRLAGKGAPSCVRDALRWTRACLDKDAQTAQDDDALKRVRKMSARRLCARYRG
jgi:DNA-binding transcriptional ArsR family regulator